MNVLKAVDYSLLRAHQGTIIALLVIAFVLNAPWLVAVVSVLMLAGSFLLRKPGFFWVGRYLLRPLGLARQEVIQDHPEPHLFAQAFGGVVLAVATAALVLQLSVLGWSLAWLVVALAALNLFGGFCVGCAIYYWLNRIHAPGFIQSPPEGAIPGFRPRQRERAQ
jgi:hypothetical protein